MTDSTAWARRYPRLPKPHRTSRYLAMPDGVRLAIELWLPAEWRSPARLPTILHQTRYYRAVDWALPFRLLGVDRFLDINATTRQAFLAAGYAWVDVDVRGSGASFGQRPSPWWRDEVRDGASVVDWIVDQPWSNGRVGATGVSYGGTCAEMLLTNRHPAVRAAAPRFSLFDVYTDVAFPGGLHLSWFTAAWAAFNQALDRDTYHNAFAGMARANLAAAAELYAAHGRPNRARALAGLDRDRVERVLAWLVARSARGVHPVGDDRTRRQIAQAVADHTGNIDVHAGSLGMTHRDDTGMSTLEPEATIESFSPHHYLDDVIGSGAAVLSYSGWLDGAYQHAAIKRHLNLPRGQSHLLLGPWDHGGRHQISPFHATGRADFDHPGELLRFFDRHLKEDGDGGSDVAPVRYYTLGREVWRSAETWPPPDSRPAPWYFGAGGGLTPAVPTTGFVGYAVDPEAGTGRRSRWRSLLGLSVLIGYGDRAVADRRLLCFTTPPLTDDLEVTGHPVVHLFVTSDQADGGFFAYLEEVDPAGRVTYVTEGQLRGLHRRRSAGAPLYRDVVPYHSFCRRDAAPLPSGEIAAVVFDLLPISYLFRRGHALRVALAGADRDHFAAVHTSPPTWRLHCGGKHPSRIDLPVVGS